MSFLRECDKENDLQGRCKRQQLVELGTLENAEPSSHPLPAVKQSSELVKIKPTSNKHLSDASRSKMEETNKNETSEKVINLSTKGIIEVSIRNAVSTPKQAKVNKPSTTNKKVSQKPVICDQRSIKEDKGNIVIKMSGTKRKFTRDNDTFSLENNNLKDKKQKIEDLTQRIFKKMNTMKNLGVQKEKLDLNLFPRIKPFILEIENKINLMKQSSGEKPLKNFMNLPMENPKSHALTSEDSKQVEQAPTPSSSFLQPKSKLPNVLLRRLSPNFISKATRSSLIQLPKIRNCSVSLVRIVCPQTVKDPSEKFDICKLNLMDINQNQLSSSSLMPISFPVDGAPHILSQEVKAGLLNKEKAEKFENVSTAKSDAIATTTPATEVYNLNANQVKLENSTPSEKNTKRTSVTVNLNNTLKAVQAVTSVVPAELKKNASLKITQLDENKEGASAMANFNHNKESHSIGMKPIPASKDSAHIGKLATNSAANTAIVVAGNLEPRDLRNSYSLLTDITSKRDKQNLVVLSSENFKVPSAVVSEQKVMTSKTTTAGRDGTSKPNGQNLVVDQSSKLNVIPSTAVPQYGFVAPKLTTAYTIPKLPNILKNASMASKTDATSEAVAQSAKLQVTETARTSKCDSEKIKLEIPSTTVLKDSIASSSGEIKVNDGGETWGPSQSGYDFVSTDPAENADNFNSGWSTMRDVTNDAERYRCIRERWRNLGIPDPSKNLTFRHRRPAEQKMQGRRRQPRTAPRHHRSQSCSSVYELMIRKAQCESQEAMLRLEARQSRDVDFLLSRHEQLLEMSRFNLQTQYYNVRDPYPLKAQLGNLMQMQMQELSNLRTMHANEQRQLRLDAEGVIRKYQEYMNEVNTFHQFYKGLNTEDNADKGILTQEQVELVEETERIYEAFKKIYK